MINHVHDFDFLAGSWNVTNRRLKERLVGCADWEEFPATSVCWPLFGGAANLDEITFSTLGYKGLTMRLYDHGRDEWSLHWASSRTGQFEPPVVGRIDGDRGEFFGDDSHNGTPVRCRFIWSGLTPDFARWEQAFSVDGEQTWETNWIMELTRTAGQPS
jgi:hypothetical protein